MARFPLIRPDPYAPGSRRERSLTKLGAAYEAAKARAKIEDPTECARELHAMESIASTLYRRALDGDTPDFRKALGAALKDENYDEARALVQQGCLEDDLFQSTFEKLDTLAKRRLEAMDALTRRAHVITQPQVVELLRGFLRGLRAWATGYACPNCLQRDADLYTNLSVPALATVSGIGVDDYATQPEPGARNGSPNGRAG